MKKALVFLMSFILLGLIVYAQTPSLQKVIPTEEIEKSMSEARAILIAVLVGLALAIVVDLIMLFIFDWRERIDLLVVAVIAFAIGFLVTAFILASIYNF